MKMCLVVIDIVELAHSTASGEAAMPRSQEGLLLPVDLEMLELRGKINTDSLSQNQYKTRLHHACYKFLQSSSELSHCFNCA